MPPLMKKALLFIERSLAVRSIESEDLHKPVQYRTWTLGTGSTIFVHALIVVSITVPLFWLNRDNLLGFIDGQYLLTLIHSEKELTPFRLGFSTNPLQGLDDLQYLFNTRWIPELAIASVLPGVWGNIAAQTAAALELFIGIGLLASWLGAGTKKTIIAAWVAALAFAPLSWPSLFYGITSDAPQLASLTVTTILVVPLWAGIGKGALWQDAVRTGAISLIVWICATAFGLFILLTAPFLVVFCTVFLIASRHAHVEFRRKLIWTACLLFMLALSGLPQALLGITLDSSFHFFREQTYRPQHRLFDGSFSIPPE